MSRSTAPARAGEPTTSARASHDKSERPIMVAGDEGCGQQRMEQSDGEVLAGTQDSGVDPLGA